MTDKQSGNILNPQKSPEALLQRGLIVKINRSYNDQQEVIGAIANQLILDVAHSHSLVMAGVEIKGFLQMSAINYQFIPTPTQTVQGSAKMPRHYSPIFTVIIGRMRIPGWILHKVDICTECDISMSTLQRALKWFVEHGYMAYDLIKKWQVFPVPVVPQSKTTAKTHADKKASIDRTCSPSPVTNDTPSTVINDTPYKERGFIKIEKQQHDQLPEPALIDQQALVVFFEEIKQPVDIIIIPDAVSPELIEEDQAGLEYPAQLNPDQKKDAKRIIKKLKQPELSQDVLFELAYILTSGKLKTTIPRCLGGLVSIANEQGYFTRTQPAGATKPDTRRIDATQAEIKARQQRTMPDKDKRAVGIAGLRAGLRGAL